MRIPPLQQTVAYKLGSRGSSWALLTKAWQHGSILCTALTYHSKEKAMQSLQADAGCVLLLVEVANSVYQSFHIVEKSWRR